MPLHDHNAPFADLPGSRDLTCTSDGAALAGAPLLRRTGTGLVPRSNFEIATLLKAAYGRDLDPAVVAPGLDVIARALNRGELGRAMVAATQLRLPRLSPAGAARLSYAEFRLTKYDPDQPRDADGRWTAEATSDLYAPAPRPLWVSDPKSPLPEAANDNHRPLSPPLISQALTMNCARHARDPDYQTKMESCRDAHEKCLGLIALSEKYLGRQDVCNWPDGTAAMIKGGMVFPFALGHPF